MVSDSVDRDSFGSYFFCVAFLSRRDALMKPAKFKKISRKDLPELPEWWKQALEDAKNSPLKNMTDEEIGQLCEELAERAAKKRQAPTAR